MDGCRVLRNFFHSVVLIALTHVWALDKYRAALEGMSFQFVKRRGTDDLISEHDPLQFLK